MYEKKTYTSKIVLVIVFVCSFLILSLPLSAQYKFELAEKRGKPIITEKRLKNNKNKENKKTGWSISPFPTMTYNTDTGLELGALCDIIYYGNGEKYPDYVHRLNADVAYYTKGSRSLHLQLDSKKLLPHIRTTVSATYITSKKYPFFGFNGLISPYFKDLNSNPKDSVSFYNIDRNMVRVKGDFQGNIFKQSKKILYNFKWAAGFAYWDYKIHHIDSKKYKNHNTLYNSYLLSGLIDPEEAKGGRHLEFKTGLVYDSRDTESSPEHGMWMEAFLYGSPDIFQNNKYDYLKLALHFRHYIPIVKNRAVFAYHLAYQGLIAGKCPYYMLTNIACLYLKQIETEGLGGKNTVRGLLYNRLVGNGYIWANFETRIKLLNINFLSKKICIATNPLIDMGMVVQKHKGNMQSNSNNPLINSGKSEKLHVSAGAGLQFIIDYNFILSSEFAKPFRRQDGAYGFNIGVNYIF